jgi:hypothetical protein
MDPVTTRPVDFTSAPSFQPVEVPPVSPPRALISDEIRRSGWVWLSHVVPMTLLLLSGQYTYSIISGDMNNAERWYSVAQAAGLLAFVMISAAIALRGQATRKLVSNGQCAALLVMSLGTMAISITFTAYTIPFDLPEWIAQRDELLSRAFCLAMPGAFYPLLLLSSFPPRRSGIAEFFIAFAGGVIAVAFTWILGYLMDSLLVLLHYHFPDWLGLIFLGAVLFGAGTLVTAAITRMTLLAYTSIRGLKTHQQQGFMFLVAIAAPLGGLWLNRNIPFPVDFQAPVIYTLALINGGLLMLPVVHSVFWHRAIWLAQCVLFPFSAYFFIVFLPWMPLSPFAMIACGAGFLMLAPIVLGLAHGYRVVDGCREEIRDGAWWKPALAGIAAACILPAMMVWNMWQDRQSLDEAIDYIYSPDYRNDIAFKGDLDRLQNSLQHLRDIKHGIYLPFITPLYNTIVFHGLVLPDAKIENLQKSFFGPGQVQQASAMFSTTSRWGGDTAPWPGIVPPTSAVLSDVQVTTEPQQSAAVSHVTVVMHNPSTAQSEFVAPIRIPEGDYVSNFGLFIGEKLVPGRVAEKKTAMWVYEKISRVQRRDPGLLIYKNRTELELRVFPFDANETRRVQIDIVHPSGTPDSITIGDKIVVLDPAAHPQSTSISACRTPSGSVAVASGTDLASYAVHRRPYLHVLIDCSKGAAYSAASLDESLRQARQAYPDAEVARVTAVNYEARDVVSNLIPVAQLNAAAIQKSLLASRGGFLEDRFLKRGLLQAYDLVQKGAPDALLRPQFVVISSHSQDALREGGLDDFLRLAPDSRIICTQNPDAPTQHQETVMGNQAATPATANDVILWKWADHYAVTLAGNRAAATFAGDVGTNTFPALYQPASGQFASVPSEQIPSPSLYADGVRTWAAQDEATLNPSLVQDGVAALIGLSKQTRILVPDSSYIAVETSSQARILEEKEKAKIHNNQVFEFEEPTATPEPATWLLLIVGAGALYFRKSFVFRKT